MLDEIWKDVWKYEGYYQVSNLGNVKSLDRSIIRSNGVRCNYKGKQLKNLLNHKGYHRVALAKDNKFKNEFTHRLVMCAFKGESELQVNHIDGVRNNNRIENLEYCTQLENMNHAVTILKNNKRYGVSKHGDNWRARIVINWKTKSLGTFSDKEDAYLAFYRSYFEAHNVYPW